jgi:hypothetical protein
MDTTRKVKLQSRFRPNFERRVWLQIEALELRLAPACTVGNNVVSCDGGNDSIEVLHNLYPSKTEPHYKIYNNGAYVGGAGNNTIYVYAGGGTNSLRVNDSWYNYSNGITYRLSAVEFLIGSLAVRYTGINGSLQLDAAQSNDLIWVDGTPVGPTVTVNAGSGNDIFEVASATSNLNNLGGPLTVNGDAGTDTVHLDDDGTTANHSYTVKSTTVQRASAPLIQYATAETLFVKAGSGADTITVITTKSGTTTTVKGYFGNDTIAVTPAGNLNKTQRPARRRRRR